jgi:hypothetical protein
MRQMHPEPRLLEQVDRPVPAVGRLDHDLGVRAGLAHGLEQRHRIIRDAHTVELLASRVHRIDHRPATMQINPDVRSLHRASLPHKRTWFVKPRVLTDSDPHGERGPAPSSHHYWAPK